jgi:hypothetical protein
MSFSHIIVASVVIVLNHVLPLIGISWPETQIGAFASNLVDIGAAIYIYLRRARQGDVTAFGARK